MIIMIRRRRDVCNSIVAYVPYSIFVVIIRRPRRVRLGPSDKLYRSEN